jgi:hypothetical protein
MAKAEQEIPKQQVTIRLNPTSTLLTPTTCIQLKSHMENLFEDVNWIVVLDPQAEGKIALHTTGEQNGRWMHEALMKVQQMA